MVLDKTIREAAAIDRLLRHYRAVGEGDWIPERGPDPPDFLIVNNLSQECAAVEHTSFIWPPDEIGWSSAVRAVIDEVRNAIRDHPSLFVLWIDHDRLEAYLADYSALSKAGIIAKWLIKELITRGVELPSGQPEVFTGPIRVVVTRYDSLRTGDVRLTRSMSTGSDLGIRLQVHMPSGRIVRSRIDQAHSALECYETMLTQKAARLTKATAATRVLAVDDYSMSLARLTDLAKVLNIPAGIDECYVWLVPEATFVDLLLLKNCEAL